MSSAPIPVPKGDELKAQIEFEKEQIKNAPFVPVFVGQVARCHFCGRPCDSETKDVEGRHRCQACTPAFTDALSQHLATCQQCRPVVYTGIHEALCADGKALGGEQCLADSRKPATTTEANPTL